MVYNKITQETKICPCFLSYFTFSKLSAIVLPLAAALPPAASILPNTIHFL